MRRAAVLAAASVIFGSLWSAPASEATTSTRALGDVALRDVVAIAADDAWTVGDGGIASHWDGAHWASQHLGGLHAPDLNGVAASSTEDVWTVGGVIVQDAFRGFATHWDGMRWRRSPVPGYPGEMILEDVAVRSGSSAYAVGRWFSVTPGGRRGGAVIVHWNGGRWRRVTAPASVVRLVGIVHSGGGSYHAVGTSASGGPVMLSIAPSGAYRVHLLPDPAGVRCSARGVASGGSIVVGVCRSATAPRLSPYIAEIGDRGRWHLDEGPANVSLSSGDGLAAIWAVGRSTASGQATILRRGHAGTWFGVAAPSFARGSSLVGVSTRTFNDAWAVGWRRTGGGSLRPLALRWDGADWSQVAVPAA